jgi:hypothetical protein
MVVMRGSALRVITFIVLSIICFFGRVFEAAVLCL